MTDVLIGALVGMCIVLWWAGVSLWAARRRTYRYAFQRAEELGVYDPAGQAYCDMATVITLGGRP